MPSLWLATAMKAIRQQADKDSQGSVMFQKTHTRIISWKVGGSEIEVAGCLASDLEMRTLE